MIAIAANRTKIANLLIKSGANVNASNNDGKSGLSLAVSIENIEVAKLLIDAGADVNLKQLKEFLCYRLQFKVKI